LIDAADLSDDASVSTVGQLLFTDAGTIAARQRLEEGVSGDALWAATWVYVTAGTDPEPLLRLVDNDDASVRVLAAAGVMSLGRVEGFDALQASINSADQLRGSHPPLTVARFAAVTLSRYTADAVAVGPTDTPEQRTALSSAWSSWLNDNRERLLYNADERIWSVQ
jgi:hypothetical protein